MLAGDLPGPGHGHDARAGCLRGQIVAHGGQLPGREREGAVAGAAGHILHFCIQRHEQESVVGGARVVGGCGRDCDRRAGDQRVGVGVLADAAQPGRNGEFFFQAHLVEPEHAGGAIGQVEAVAMHGGEVEAVIRRASGLRGAAMEESEGEFHFLPAGHIIHETGLETLGRVRGLVDAYVIDRQVLREGHPLGDGAAEVAADGQVEDEIEGMVVDPLVRGHVGRGGVVVVDAIDEPVDLIRPPLHGEGVVGAGHAAGEIERGAEAGAAGVARPVDGAEHVVRELADVFHDVDLARLRPADFVDIRAQHPEGGPEAGGAGRNQGAGLDAAIFEFVLLGRDQAGGGVVAGAVPALAGVASGGLLQREDEVAGAIVAGVGRIVAVELGFAVAPAGDAVHRAIADLVRPLVRVGRRPRRPVELIAPDHDPVGGGRLASAGGGVVVQFHRHPLAVAGAVVPEAETVVGAPVLRLGEGAGEAGRGGGSIELAAEHAFIGVLARPGRGIPGHQLAGGQRHIAGGGEGLPALEIIDQGGVGGVVVLDCYQRPDREAQVGAGRIAEVEHESAVAIVLAVVEAGDAEAGLALARREGQCAAHGREVAPGPGRALGGNVIDADGLGGGPAQGHGHIHAGALDHAVADSPEFDFQGRFAADLAVEGDVIDEVALAAHIHRAKAADGVAPDLIQGQAVVGGAVADLFAVELGEGDGEELPAREGVGDVHRPAFGVVAGGARVAVLGDVDEEHAAGVVAVQPEADAFIARPVLRHPGIGGLVAEGVGGARPLAGADGQVELQHGVGITCAGHGGRRGSGHGHGRRGGRVIPGHKADAVAIRIRARRQFDQFEVIDDGGAHEQADVVDEVALAAHIHRAKAADGVAPDLIQGQAVVGGAVADLFAVELGEGDGEELPARERVGDVHRPALGVVAGGAGVAVFGDVEEEAAAGVVAV